MSIKVEFFGLCCLIERHDCYEVYLLDGGTPPTPECGLGPVQHVATMVTKADSFDDGAPWPPFIGNIGGSQIAVWKIDPSAVIVFGSGGTPSWANKSGTLQFGDLHRDVYAKSLDALNGGMKYPVIVLRGGALGGGADTKDIKVNGQTRRICRSVVWTSADTGPMTVTRNGKAAVTLHDNAAVVVTNVSAGPMPKGMEHFGFYYTIFNERIECVNRPTLEAVPMGGMTMLGPDVYDCVPPTGGS